MPSSLDMKTIVTLSQTRGFVYQGSEIYGGLANSWDYGPLGSVLKDNIRALWLKNFVQKRTDMVQLDAAILMNPQVWVASGHVGGFSDPLVDCKACKTRHRADKIVEWVFKEEVTTIRKHWLNANSRNWVQKWEQLSGAEQQDWIKKDLWDAMPDLPKDDVTWIHTLSLNPVDPIEKALQHTLFTQAFGLWARMLRSFSQDINSFLTFFLNQQILCPNCGKCNWTEIRNFNLMFSTKQWVTDDSSATVYLRPETAQGIFVNFPNIARSSRKKVPFGVAQIGKAFRNEITPGNFIFRTREFEQMEIEYFCEPESIAPGRHLEKHAEWKHECMKFLTDILRIKPADLKFRDHDQDELSHYSAATTDIEYKFPFGWGELWGIADRTDFDLKAHMSESKQDLSYFDPFTNTKYVPYVIEPSVGLSRLFLVVMLNAYDEVVTEEGSRIVMRFAPAVAPIKVGIYPIVKKFSEQGKALFATLSEDFVCDYDESGTIGKRYHRADEMGIPYAICVDAETVTDDTELTIRDRDSGEQVKVAVKDVAAWLKNKGC